MRKRKRRPANTFIINYRGKRPTNTERCARRFLNLISFKCRLRHYDTLTMKNRKIKERPRPRAEGRGG